MWMDSEYMYLGGVRVDIDSKTLKRKNSAKIGSPIRHLSQDRFFRWNIRTDHDMAVYIIING